MGALDVPWWSQRDSNSQIGGASASVSQLAYGPIIFYLYQTQNHIPAYDNKIKTYH